MEGEPFVGKERIFRPFDLVSDDCLSPLSMADCLHQDSLGTKFLFSILATVPLPYPFSVEQPGQVRQASISREFHLGMEGYFSNSDGHHELTLEPEGGVGVSGVGVSGDGVGGVTGDGVGGVTGDGVGGVTGDGVGGVTGDGDGVSGDGVSGDGVSGDGVSGDGVTGDGVSGDGVSGDGVSGDGVSGDGVSGDGVSGDGVSGDGVSGVTGEGVGVSLSVTGGSAAIP